MTRENLQQILLLLIELYFIKKLVLSYKFTRIIVECYYHNIVDSLAY